jgi:hypothetical protein
MEADYLLSLPKRPRGCWLPPGAPKDGDRWLCQIYLGGALRTIGRGTIYQCARLADAARVWFAKYRTARAQPHPADFNFTEAQALADQTDVQFVRHFSEIEEFFRAEGKPLLTKAEKITNRKFARIEAKAFSPAPPTFNARLTAVEQAVAKLRTHNEKITNVLPPETFFTAASAEIDIP